MTVQQEATQQEATQGVILTDVAATKVSTLLAQEGRDRPAAAHRGPAGRLLRPALPAVLRRAQLDGDVVSDFGGVEVVTDKMSAPYLIGATVDFVDTIEKQGFTIDNPNATGSCACGDSFH